MKKMTSFRWTICALLFAATLVNYLDRQVLSLTWKDFIAPEFHWDDSHYGIVTGGFSLVYAVCMLFVGKITDRLGTHRGYLWAISFWSGAAALHAVCGVLTQWVTGYESYAALRAVQAGSQAAVAIATVSTWLFLACRCLLAAGESGNFPSAVKSVTEYFPAKDRAFATSIYNAGSSVGALLAPLTIPLIARRWGWEAAFILVGGLGFLWMGFWMKLHRVPSENPRVNAEELAYIESGDRVVSSDSAVRRFTYGRAFGCRQTWGLVLERLFTDGVWWFYLFWTPSYLKDRFGYTSDSFSGMMLIVLLYAIVAGLSIVLCRIPKLLVERRGMNAYEGRLVAMFFFACLPLLAIFAQPMGGVSPYFVSILIGIACAGHQAWSANVYSAIGDLFPKHAIGTLTGITGLACGIGSFTVNITAGRIFKWSEGLGDALNFLGYHGKEAGYMMVFCYCGIAYLIGWTALKLLVPRYRPVEG